MITDEQFMNIAKEVSKSSHCNNYKVGSIIVKDNNIIAIGYNGTPTGFDNACEIDGITKTEVLHAESNAIAKCSKSMNSSENSTIYSTLAPCLSCAKMIIQSGIKKVFYSEKYRDNNGVELLKKAKIEVHER